MAKKDALPGLDLASAAFLALGVVTLLLPAVLDLPLGADNGSQFLLAESERRKPAILYIRLDRKGCPGSNMRSGQRWRLQSLPLRGGCCGAG
jgi:hypothetical protein